MTMGMPGIVLGMPASVLELNQQGLIEREFYDGLFPTLSFRSEAMAEEWEGHTGQEVFQTRPGLLKPRTNPLPPGVDPVPQAVPYEMWVVRLNQYADAIDTHMPTATTSSQNLFFSNIKQLGMQAGQSINRIARNELFRPYLGGNTALTAATLTTDTQLQVASINGFIDVVVPGKNVKPANVSTANPLSVTVGVGGGAVKANVVGVMQANPDDPFGPGTLLLGAQIGTVFAARTAVISASAPRIVRSGGGSTVDAIGASDTLLLQDVINAVALLRKANVQPHPDGFYHAHISPLAEAQVFADPVFQRLNQSLPNGMAYTTGFIGHISQVAFYMDNETPDPTNSGVRTPTGTQAMYSPDIAAETTNENGIDIGRVILTGQGAIYERYLDESQYVTEAGTVGKIGTFNITNGGVQILTERIRLILRAPQDRLQQMVSAAWSITTSFPVPSDSTAPSGPERFKRAIIIEHAL